ncbi:TetR/AcrR family transcriptional regulator [Sodalis sp. RH21]|uniref:TetR/AcrR family transcriptional regulator n=1 Tax=unclassified Sodalis (in: enterobacteria) TaxID=2636512 RepID=UPI0039B66C8F
MAKTWSADNPKATLMARKQALIVDAALKAFLSSGYAETSVNQIAADAGVSIKTLYRHFESKDDLFSAVMQAACGNMPGADASGEESTPTWYKDAPSVAFPRIGEEYLRHVLSRDQLALYRVVTRDALRFPELGRRYLQETTGRRDAKFAGYLDIWADHEGWQVHDRHAAAQIFAGLLKARIYDEALLGVRLPSEDEIVGQARDAAQHMLQLLR